MCRKLLVRDEQEMFALASEENHVDELYHALKGLLGQERDYTSTVFAGEITFSHLRASPSLSCCRQVLPSLCWWQLCNISFKMSDFSRRRTI